MVDLWVQGNTCCWQLLFCYTLPYDSGGVLWFHVGHPSVHLLVHLSIPLSYGNNFVQRCPKKHTNDTFGDYFGLFHYFFVIMKLHCGATVWD